MKFSAKWMWAPIAATLLFSYQSANALVDMKNANYTETWVDIELPGSGYDLKIERTYNSRSLFNGLFGYGWCSDFETQLEVTAEGALKVTECGAGLETTYIPKSFGDKNIHDVAQRIVNEMKKKAPGMNAKAMADKVKELEKDSTQREQMAEQYGIKGAVKNGTRFYANGSVNDFIEYKENLYIRALADGSNQRFDSAGHLVYLYDKNGNYLKFSYAENHLKDMVDNNGRKLTFSFMPNGKVKSVVGPNGIEAQYKYEDLNNLSWSKSASNQEHTYKYDDLHNMIEVAYPDKTKKSLKYNKEKDWVTSLTDRTGCTETYGYELSKDDPKNHYWSTVEKKCDNKVTNKSKFEFWYANMKGSGESFLARTKSTVNGDTAEYGYNPEFGKPSYIIKNNVKTEFTYFPSGLLKTKKVGSQVTSFKYETTHNKVSEVVSGKTKSWFKYDNKGNLIAAENSHGQKVVMAYDSSGRITSIVDQAKKRVNITYEPHFGKPATVERPGLGTIKVTYKKNGDIDKVDSPDGPHIAVQVASAFNNLLEIVSPAGIDLSL